MGTRPRWTYEKQIWHKGSRGRLNHVFQILAKSVKGFPSCEGPKIGVSHWLWLSPLQQVSTTVLPVITPQQQNNRLFVNIAIMCHARNVYRPIVYVYTVFNGFPQFSLDPEYIVYWYTWNCVATKRQRLVTVGIYHSKSEYSGLYIVAVAGILGLLTGDW